MPFMPEFSNNNKEEKSDNKINQKNKIDTISKITKNKKNNPNKEQKNNINDLGKKLFSWEAPEYYFHKKGFLWYFIFILIIITLILLMIYFKQWILIGVVAVSVLIIVQYSARKPKNKKFSLYEKGIETENKKYYFVNFKSFWIIETPQETTLNLLPIKKFFPPVVIPLGKDLDLEKLKINLSKILPQQIKRLDIIDRIMNKIKF